MCCVAQNNRKSAIWEEEDDEIWEGAPPRLEIAYDAKNGYLLTAQFTVDRKESEKSEVRALLSPKAFCGSELCVSEVWLGCCAGGAASDLH